MESNPDLQSLVFDELRRLAANQMASERPDHTLQPTALVNEAWLRLQGSKAANPENRALFFHAAAESMRRILIEHARSKKSQRKGGDFRQVPVNLGDLAAEADSDRILAVDEAIQRICAQDERAGAVIRLRFYAGLTVTDTAEALGTSERSVHREWAYARARLAQLLEDDDVSA